MPTTNAPPRKIESDADDYETESSATGTTGPVKARKQVRRRSNKAKGNITAENFVYGMLQYALDVLLNILSLLKWPLALVLTIMLGRFLLFHSLNRITGAVSSQLRTGLCSIPFARPFLATTVPNFCSAASPIDFADLVSLQRDSVEVAKGPVYAGSLPLQLKQAEMATGDLRAVLAQSELSCKDSLDDALASFTVHARDSGRAIQRTVVRVRGMVDAQLAMNEWALASLHRIGEDRSSSVLGAVMPFLGAHETRVSVTETYVRAMDELSGYVRRLIEVNQAAYEGLSALEEDLARIHSVIGLERQFQHESSSEDVLSSLWSLLGGNRKTRAIFRENLRILGDFEKGRVANKEVVAATSVAFSQMMYQIEYMREQIQRPGLVGETVPIEVHIRNIELGIESLKGTREFNRKEALEGPSPDLLLD
ncbi:Putative uncharacterized protein [Taphrina deformans PYCC 5710]|uniref:Uncharacterized protein n=1 Tax=Taphrina deformans (strain PYCC 5710 / ATCC 11124 / CBS 356.35 / IMI 108563 / JCM 9778 / NBRC 8474) TaxID=1097556 RepID=R4XCB0_TAPDE|nr:Putative uncharacterized protein [Taphrina deformans PYCC 5710]|eukprot:CCG82011.1 Putative uncharacterized protein [Taphrina deformans PYCC 5710]